jgi:hypothetical protein
MQPCLNDCRGQGTCLGGVCTCNPYFTGVDCSIVIPKCGDTFHCLNLGTCDASGVKCNCLPFYMGKDCSKRIRNPKCPQDFTCGNGGRCYMGKCLCVPGTFGYDCQGSFGEFFLGFSIDRFRNFFFDRFGFFVHSFLQQAKCKHGSVAQSYSILQEHRKSFGISDERCPRRHFE